MLLPFFIATTSYPRPETNRNELVILLHGIFTTSLRLTRLHRTLHREGYTVLSITYPSRQLKITELASKIALTINGHRDQFQAVHMVGHSMGGLLARAYLARPDALPVKRLVCLGTPNQGTEFIDQIQHRPWSARLFQTIGGPSGNELGSDTSATSIVKILGTAAPRGVETGVIAGKVGWWLGPRLPRPHDGYVPVERTKLEGLRDHKVVACDHVTMTWRSRVIGEVRRTHLKLNPSNNMF